MDEFAVFILTHGRPDKVTTQEVLRKNGYTGRIFLVVDDADPTQADYQQKFPGQVLVFNKKAIAKTFDQGDNFANLDDNHMKSVVYARNAAFQLAKELNIPYLMQLDDDFIAFSWRFDANFEYIPATSKIMNLDTVFQSLLDFYQATPVHCLALSQGGDFIGGKRGSPHAKGIQAKRKSMGCFIVSTLRPFSFVGRINEDVNTYTSQGRLGILFLMLNQISGETKRTQQHQGGMADLYLASGTYVKSFFSILFSPSCVKIMSIGNVNYRLHHRVQWKQAVPLIIRERHKKAPIDNSLTTKNN